MSRQAVLRREPPLELQVIIDEAALRRLVGGEAVMRAQFGAIVALGGTVCYQDGRLGQ